MGTSEHTEISSAIDTRLARIERELTAARRDAVRWRTGTIIVGAVALAGGLVAATQVARVEDVIRVRRLEVVGEGDKVVMLAQAGETGGQLDVWSKGGANVVRMSAGTDGGLLADDLTFQGQRNCFPLRSHNLSPRKNSPTGHS